MNYARVRDLELAEELDYKIDRVLLLAITKIKDTYPLRVSEEELRIHLGIRSHTVMDLVVEHLFFAGYGRVKKNKKNYIVELSEKRT